MEIERAIFFGILLAILGLYSTQIVNIGVINGVWKTALDAKLINRKWNDKCRTIEIRILPNISFYESISEAHKILTTLKIDVIIGDSRLDIAQAAATLSIPYISFDTKLHIGSKDEYRNMPHFYSLPVSEAKYALATFDILKYYKIRNVAIIVDETVDYKNFIQMFFEEKSLFSKVWTIPSRPTTDQPKKIGEILKEIRKNEYLDIIVKTNKHNLIGIFEKAQFFGMVANPNRWYLPNFICENFNIEKLKHIYTNFTFINEDCSERTMADNTKSEQESLPNQFLQIIRLVKWNFSVVNLNQFLKNNPNTLLSFDELGQRNQFSFIFHTISKQAGKLLSMIGSWQKTIGNPRMFHMKFSENGSEYSDIGFPSVLKVVAVEEHPHLIVRENNTFVGFGVDLTQKMADILNFSFSINIVNSYGAKINGKWDGLMGEIVYGRSDMSLGPVVQTREGEEILDFSTTFKQREISLVMKKPNSTPSYFQFLGPFSRDIWLCVASSIILLIIILIVIEHYHDKYFPEDDRIKFNLKESSWFIVASTLQGGTENVPFSVPGRILTGTLYFFVMIIVTSYTANLAAFLTVKAYSNPINSVDDLANLPSKSKIKFGTVGKSAIHDFFKHSELPVYQRIYKMMTIVNKGWLVNSTSEGYKRTMQEDYVFIWDDSVNQYEISTEKEYDCQLYIVGRPFGKRSFAISMSQGSCFKEKINAAILNLLESGVIENLEHKWWKSTSICSNDAPSSEISSGSLSVEELAGVFLVLLCGSILAVMSLVIKIFFYRCKPKQKIVACCGQFFEHLPPDTEPPIVPNSSRTMTPRSKVSTLGSMIRDDCAPSPSNYALQRFFPSNDPLDDDDHHRNEEPV